MMFLDSQGRLTITIDTREQRPWHFPPHEAASTRGTLHTGDYALTGDGGFAIERKSLDDLVSTLSSGWDRFERELDRMAGWPARVIIVEGGFEQLVFETRQGEVIPPAHSHYRVSPQFILRRLSELVMRGVCVLFAGNDEYAAGMAYAVLRRRKEQLERIEYGAD